MRVVQGSGNEHRVGYRRKYSQRFLVFFIIVFSFDEDHQRFEQSFHAFGERAVWEQDGIAVGVISSRLLADPGSLTPLLQRLEAEGLLRRTRSKKDERVVRLYLTAQGKALRQKALNIPQNIILASGISFGKSQSMQQDLNKLRGNLHDSL